MPRQHHGSRQPSRPGLTLALTGDVMLGRLVNEVLLREPPAYPWGDVLPLLLGADLRIINLECVIARAGRPWPGKAFHFRAGPHAIAALKAAHIDAVSLANNHSLDFGTAALLETLERLDRAGIAHAGAGRNRDEAQRPALLEARGWRVGLVAFTDNEPDWAATPTTPGTAWIPITLTERSLAPVRESIARARTLGADLVVFSIHWGPNLRLRPTALFREFAHAVLEAGADLYHGHSAHVFQGIEVYRGRPILYDCGDFVDDYAVDPDLRNDWSFLYLVHVTEGAWTLELVPTVIGDLQVRLATGPEREAILERMERLCGELGTALQRRAGRLFLTLPAAAGFPGAPQPPASP